jgi:hypothetical protein
MSVYDINQHLSAMAQLCKQQHLLPTRCNDFEFNIGEKDNTAIVYGFEYWPTKERYDSNGKFIKPTQIDFYGNTKYYMDMPNEFKKKLNQYGAKCIQCVKLPCTY